MRSTQLRRDADLSSDDNITVLIDSYRDRRGAFLFRTNPNGAMWDAQLVGFGQRQRELERHLGRRHAARFGVVDGGVRDSASAPCASIPANDVIGLNVRRIIRRKNEEDLWQSWGRAQGIENLLNTGRCRRASATCRGNRPSSFARMCSAGGGAVVR